MRGLVAVTVLVPTFEPGGQVEGLSSGSRSHCSGVAWGLTVSPLGRSTRTVRRLPIGTFVAGSGPGSVLTMNWVNPTGG